jgi:hypothetical protein
MSKVPNGEACVLAGLVIVPARLVVIVVITILLLVH